MKKITKAILPVAGLGTRFLPATKAIPKEMLTVVDKPLIQYIVEEAAEAGITEIILVTHSSKSAIENHFDKNYELESELKLRGKEDRLALIEGVLPAGVKIISVRQPEALGLGHAILCAKSVLADDEPFAVMLPDVLMYHAEKGCLAQMMSVFNQTQASTIALEAVPEKDVEKYGIAAVESVSAGLKITELVEKPSLAEAPSNLSVVGRYIFTPRLMDLLENTKAGVGGEIQVTDAMDELLAEQAMYGFEFVGGKSYDCGDKLGYLKANIEYGLRDEKLNDDFSQYLSELN